ncbi:DUF937 domain-containing protein [Sphingomonas koreensis]|jgi:hypothetical protein|uniref:DUF937 domain-containing protein n=1 Tax=Sphingomonas koreensis TaxID=93064 RepID=A0A1L6JCC8_9SPHN|nr:DUF937 domain-containing protein [Sphingomonas koreensis]APR53572.1 hypothetical protein BRX40_15095 [Sphingomonas koreensis]MDC7809703.1 DUF937 domain-containing protein [Sphingomonas koreensis]RSU20968.1 DUF937 domain-containing protein [Sphingomonas koreensis]RSU22105.1 DUF937 domain-containing protein [Sphingomonas koreensis]RSU24294.1 DUF937 domain-containing protein [Sphingomonas koreensis]
MNLTDILAQAGGIDSMARDLGVSPETAKAGADALLPAILGGFKKQAQTGGGIEGLGGLLGQLGGGGLLDAVLGSQPTPVDRGNDVLGQIFGSKDVSRTVAGHAAEQSGLDSGLLKKMLPILAMLVAGYLAKQGGQEGEGGGLGGLIGGMLGGGGGAGGLGGVLGSVLSGGAASGGGAPAASGGLGGLGKLIDLNGDGNPLDDIIGMAGKLRG